MTAKELNETLKENGFKKMKSWAKGVHCFHKGKLYAEVYAYTKGWYEAWIVGPGIPNTGTISYPGGTRTEEPKRLNELILKA